MASLIPFNSAYCSLFLPLTHKLPARPLFSCPCVANARSLRFSFQLGSRKGASLVVTRAGPSTSNYVFAFVLPLSLIAITVFTSIRISDRLDRKFLEELAVNEAILEADEEEDDVDTSADEEPKIPRSRNRPKREAKTSSM